MVVVKGVSTEFERPLENSRDRFSLSKKLKKLWLLQIWSSWHSLGKVDLILPAARKKIASLGNLISLFTHAVSEEKALDLDSHVHVNKTCSRL